MMQNRAAGPRPVGRREADKETGAYQVDLIIAFFSVLLVLLIVSGLRVAKSDRDESKSTYKSEDVVSTNFDLTSFAPLYPYRDTWIARKGQLIKLNLPAVAERFAETGGDLYSNLKPIDIIAKTDPASTGSYNLTIDFVEDAVPQWIITDAIALAPAAPAAARLLASPRGLLVFVWPRDRATFARVAERLRSRGQPLEEQHLQSDAGKIEIGRRSGYFELDSVLRNY